MPYPVHTPLMAQQTIKYKTYIKETLVGAMQAVFSTHPDDILQRTVHVSSNLPEERAEFPAVLVRFYERDLHNLGVGHQEWLPVVDDTNTNTGEFIKFKHYAYSGDIEFGIFALSSPDRDLVGDSIVQTLTMGSTETYTSVFWNALYRPSLTTNPTAAEHFINLLNDRIQGYGESEEVAPWMPEDVLVYRSSYRIPIFGEFYSRTPDLTPAGMVSAVSVYPYEKDLGDVPPDPNPNDHGPWVTEGDQLFF